MQRAFALTMAVAALLGASALTAPSGGAAPVATGMDAVPAAQVEGQLPPWILATGEDGQVWRTASTTGSTTLARLGSGEPFAVDPVLAAQGVEGANWRMVSAGSALGIADCGGDDCLLALNLTTRAVSTAPWNGPLRGATTLGWITGQTSAWGDPYVRLVPFDGSASVTVPLPGENTDVVAIGAEGVVVNNWATVAVSEEQWETEFSTSLVSIPDGNATVLYTSRSAGGGPAWLGAGRVAYQPAGAADITIRDLATGDEVAVPASPYDESLLLLRGGIVRLMDAQLSSFAITGSTVSAEVRIDLAGDDVNQTSLKRWDATRALVSTYTRGYTSYNALSLLAPGAASTTPADVPSSAPTALPAGGQLSNGVLTYSRRLDNTSPRYGLYSRSLSAGPVLGAESRRVNPVAGTSGAFSLPRATYLPLAVSGPRQATVVTSGAGEKVQMQFGATVRTSALLPASSVKTLQASGPYLAVQLRNGRVDAYDTRTGAKIGQFGDTLDSWLTHQQLALSGRHLAIVGTGGRVLTVDLANPKAAAAQVLPACSCQRLIGLWGRYLVVNDERSGVPERLAVHDRLARMAVRYTRTGDLGSFAVGSGVLVFSQPTDGDVTSTAADLRAVPLTGAGAFTAKAFGNVAGTRWPGFTASAGSVDGPFATVKVNLRPGTTVGSGQDYPLAVLPLPVPPASVRALSVQLPRTSIVRGSSASWTVETGYRTTLGVSIRNSAGKVVATASRAVPTGVGSVTWNGKIGRLAAPKGVYTWTLTGAADLMSGGAITGRISVT